MIRKIIYFVLIAGLAGYLLKPFSPCDKPIPYRIGTIDSKFNISSEQFTSDVEKAIEIWNKASGKKLFSYDPQAPLSISLVYDGRQTLTNQINQLENNLDQQKKDIDPKIQQYEQQSAEFKKKLADLNSQIESWNQKGGAPQDVYDQLMKQQQDLKKQADELNAQAKSLNRSTDNYNAQIGKLDQTVSTFNETLQLKPEEGTFDPTRNVIEIYFNISQPELIHTLTHELGHALGMDHNQNPKSILYPKTTQALIPSAEDMAELNKVCRQRTMAEVLRDRAEFIYSYYYTSH